MPSKWTHVLVHHSASPDSDDIDRDPIESYHVNQRGWRAIGYHRVYEIIGDRYHALEGRPLTWSGSHCPGMNSRAIGVCFVGDFTHEPPPSLQLEVGAIDIAGLCYLGGIPLINILPHRDKRATACPGDSFPMGQLLKRVKHWYESR
jgi:hypothetical protein